MSTRHPIQIRKGKTGEYVYAALVEGVSKEELAAAQVSWDLVKDETIDRLRRNKVPMRDWPGHRHWDWRAKHAETLGLHAYQFFAVECDNETQGLMLLDTGSATLTLRSRIPEQKGKPLVYVKYIETAPWNSRMYVPEARYKLVGNVLLFTAIQASLELEWAGRIGLHALPQSESWYRMHGMTDLGIDLNVEKLRYFEMTPSQATAFLEGKRRSDL